MSAPLAKGEDGDLLSLLSSPHSHALMGFTLADAVSKARFPAPAATRRWNTRAPFRLRFGFSDRL